jgi:hypothetical protein
MSRPKKTGLDYFPLDVIFDDEVLLIDAKFGCAGLCVLIKLWQIIYSNNYYIKWGERELLVYKTRINADINFINDVINECLKWGIFNESLYNKYGILTSKGIQKRFIEATQRRTEVEFIKEYLLIKDVEKLYPRKSKNGEFMVNVNIIGINDSNNEINDDFSTQSKVKESRVEKSKVNRKYKRLFVEDSIEFQLSKKLLDYILINNPNYKMPNLQNWAQHIDYMIRLDKRTPEQINDIIVFSQEDSFWKSNILSTEKLRQKFDQLWIKKKNGKPKSTFEILQAEYEKEVENEQNRNHQITGSN